jgi:ribonuclease P protein component
VKRRFRLTRSTDFKRVRRIGKSYAHPLVVFITAPNDLDHPRLGVVAGKAVGTAVRRNYAKRRLRACLDQHLACLSGGWDGIFLARKPIDQAGFAELCGAVHLLLERAGLMNDRT